MKYKIGDKVRVRQCNAMRRDVSSNNGYFRYGYIYWDNSINAFIPSTMGEYCGKVLTIKAIFTDAYKVEENIYNWIDEMFEGYAFEYGDLIEVSSDNKLWVGPIHYLSYIDGCDLQYITCEKELFKQKDIRHYIWRYARPYKETSITLTINGKEVELSKETIENIKKIL